MKNIAKWSAQLSLVIGLFALIAMLLAGPGYQAGWWELMTALRSIFPKVVIAAGVAILLGSFGFLGPYFVGEKPNKIALIGILAGIAAATVPLSISKTAKSVPMIHDITTDTTNPPQFVEVVELRKDAPNPVSYDRAISAQQLDAYPDIKSIELDSSVSDVFSATLKVVDSMGWELVGSDAKSGRIEATETTTWFGFKDDVVIRIQSKNNKSIVDVRSKSRLGKSDLGANAERIRKFVHDLQTRLEK